MPAIMQFHGKDHRGGDIWRVYPDYDRMKPGGYTIHSTEKQAQKAVDEANGVVKEKKTEAQIRAAWRVEPYKDHFEARGPKGYSMEFGTREEAEAKVAKALKAALKREGY